MHRAAYGHAMGTVRETEMRLWLIEQSANDDWDTYDSAIVAAETEEAARQTHPSNGPGWTGEQDEFPTWAYSPSQVRVKQIGIGLPGTKAGVICASFNAS
jgi:hypothetical protein